MYKWLRAGCAVAAAACCAACIPVAIVLHENLVWFWLCLAGTFAAVERGEGRLRLRRRFEPRLLVSALDATPAEVRVNVFVSNNCL